MMFKTLELWQILSGYFMNIMYSLANIVASNWIRVESQVNAGSSHSLERFAPKECVHGNCECLELMIYLLSSFSMVLEWTNAPHHRPGICRCRCRCRPYAPHATFISGQNIRQFRCRSLSLCVSDLCIRTGNQRQATSSPAAFTGVENVYYISWRITACANCGVHYAAATAHVTTTQRHMMARELDEAKRVDGHQTRVRKFAWVAVVLRSTWWGETHRRMCGLKFKNNEVIETIRFTSEQIWTIR